MIINRLFSVLCYQFSCMFLALLISQVAEATSNLGGHAYAPASTGTITFDPVLPTKGESFTVRMSGTWGNRCIPEQDRFTMWAEDNGGGRQNVKMTTYYSADPACHEQFEPTPFELSCTLPNWIWEVLNNDQHWNINISVQPDFNSNGIGSYWRQKFDPTYGLHAIPPKLGTGYWISENTPYQGLTIMQQGNTVVAYEMAYNRVTGEPIWKYGHGRFNGNSLNGMSYQVNWLAPSNETIPGYNWMTDPRSESLFQPKLEDLHFAPSSFGLLVYGVNKIAAHVGLHNEKSAIFYTYKRWVFGGSDTELPPVVPDMAGIWNLYGFDEQHLKQTHRIEFKAGNKMDDGLYRFSSVDEQWLLSCQVKLDGEGDCTLSNENLGMTMTYNLISNIHIYDGSIEPHFNGNYAYAPIVDENGTGTEQTGILLRDGLHLPVFDVDEYPTEPDEPVIPPEDGGFRDRYSCSGS